LRINGNEQLVRKEREVDMSMQNGNKKDNGTLKVVLACYYPLLVEGVCKILEGDKSIQEGDKSIQVISKVSNALDLVQSCEEFKFDILLLDVDLQGLNLAKVLQLLKKNKGAKVILIVNNDYSENTLVNAIRSGVRGYLLKNADSSRLLKAIRAVNDGELWVERKMMIKVLEAFSSPRRGTKGGNSIYDLTETEARVVKLVLNGGSNKDVAKNLFLSEKTVKFHLYKIFKKLSVKNRSQLILYGFKNGFLN
jgi:two-component system, NarL family, response regulator DegU